jgi:cytoskeletal protein RodZ
MGKVLYNGLNEVIIMRHMKKPGRRSLGSINSVVWVVLALIIVIAGYKFFYPNHVTNTTSSSDKSSSTKVIEVEEGNSSSSKAQSSSKKAKKTESKIWTDKQDSELATFVSSWQQTMGQTYKGTNGDATVSFGGVKFPDFISEGPLYVDQQEVSMKWTTSKKSDSDYKVVAAYAGSMYLYLFTFHDDQPEVLVTSQAASDGMNFKVTENADLVSGFQKIATENNDN